MPRFSIARLLASIACIAGSVAAITLIVDPAVKGAFDLWPLGYYAIVFGLAMSSISAGAAVGILARSRLVGTVVAAVAFAAHYILYPVIWLWGMK